MEKQLYTVAEAAEMLSLHYKTVLKLINGGFIHSSRIGRKHLISRREIDKFVNAADKHSIIYYLK